MVGNCVRTANATGLVKAQKNLLSLLGKSRFVLLSVPSVKWHENISATLEVVLRSLPSASAQDGKKAKKRPVYNADDTIRIAS